jgi:hypothetical protein
MTETWKEEQLLWLAHTHEIRRRVLDSSVDFEEFPQPESSQVALLQIFTDALDGKVTPVTAAKQISDWVLSVPDIDICYDIQSAYDDMLGIVFSSARQLSSRNHLKILADLTVELANLPDVYNNKDKPIEFDLTQFGGGSIVVQPGERIKLLCETGGELWSTLPNFAQFIGDDLVAGPSRYFRPCTPTPGNPPYATHKAEDKYTNINTFAALIAQQHPPQESPLSECVHYAMAVFSYLEHGPDTNLGNLSHLAVRAAAAWLTIAGEEVVVSGSPFIKYEYYTSGSLWEAAGGTNTVDVKRLRLWKDSFQQLRESGRLSSQEAVDATVDAAAALDRLIASQG